MASTNCVGNEYGYVEHTLFLGCTIEDFQVSAGWNDQITEITVTLVQDDCQAPIEQPKYYYNTLLNKVSTTDADPGFMGEAMNIIGLCAYFRYVNFEFCGLIQSWEEGESLSGRKYTVKLISPMKILQESQLIIGHYAGGILQGSIFSTTAPHNVFNVYGFAESFSSIQAPLVYQSSPGVYSFGDSGIDGAVFGTPAGGFGGANVNDGGMQWNTIKNCLSVLTSSLPKVKNAWSPHGRLTHRGINLADFGYPWTNGYGLLQFDNIINFRYVNEYYLDISELPALPSYFRFPNTTISILDVINTVCESSSCEYFLELLPINNGAYSAGGVDKIIKVRVVNKAVQASLGQIDSFISSAQSAGILINSSHGAEFRDNQTSSILIGGNKETIYQAYQDYDPDNNGNPDNPEEDDMILPFFGTDISGNMIVPRLDASGFWEFDVSVQQLNQTLKEYYYDTDFITINEKELLTTNSFDSWRTFVEDIFNPTDSLLLHVYESTSLAPAIFSDQKALVDARNPEQFAEDMGWTARDLINLKTARQQVTEDEAIIEQNKEADLQKIYRFITSFANNYGIKYAVRVPYIATYFDTESQTYKFSEEPSNEGWTEEADIIGLPNGTLYTDFFSSDNGKINAFARFNNMSGIELDGLSSEQFLTYDNDLYIKCYVDNYYVFHNRFNLTYPRVIVNLPQPITIADELDSETQGFQRILRFKNPGININKLLQFQNQIGGQVSFESFRETPYEPYAVCFGIRSNVNTYGPWSSIGPAGGIKIEKNDGLTPWEYGSYSAMQVAANELVDAGLSNTQYGELGSITVAGAPALPIFAELNSSSILNGNHLIENRFSSYHTFSTSNVGGFPISYNSLIFNYGFSLNGSYGPNVTNISINFGIGGITTTYSMRTYTPTFGKFAELNAQRLRQIGQNTVKQARYLRFNAGRNTLLSSQVEVNNNYAADLDNYVTAAKIVNKNRPNARYKKPFTPHELLGGENIVWHSGAEIRSLASTYSTTDVLNLLQNTGYASKSIMSLDGLLRPFSMTGGYNLPRYIANPTGTTRAGTSVFAVDSGNNITGTGIGSSSLTVLELNPFFNPLGYEFSQLAQRHTGTLGHDIDIVARSTGITGSLILRHKSSGTGYDYADNYRPMALRGPLVMSSWGYTLDGKPIPNQNDTEINIHHGIYATSGLSDNFYPDFGHRSDLWPTGPIDLRFDTGRGVWTIGQEEDIHIRTLQHIGPKTGGKCLIINPINNSPISGYLDTSGNLIQFPIVSGFDIDNRLIASGTQLRLKYNNSRNRYEINSKSSLTVVITGTVNGATWDRNITGLTPSKFVCYPFIAGPSGILTYTTGTYITGWNRFKESISASEGFGYISTLEDGWLDNSDCKSIQL